MSQISRQPSNAGSNPITSEPIAEVSSAKSSSTKSTSSSWFTGITAFLGRIPCSFRFGKSSPANTVAADVKGTNTSATASEHAHDVSSAPLNVKSSSWFSRLFASSAVTSDGPEKFITNAELPKNSNSFIRIDSDKKLSFTADNTTKTSYLTRGRENEAIARHVIELFGQKFGTDGAAIAKAVLHDEEIGFRQNGYISASMINCIHENVMTSVHIPKLMESAIKESTTKPIAEVLTSFSSQRTPATELTILSSEKTVSLPEKGVCLASQVNPTTIATLPEAYCCILGSKERNEVLHQTTGFVDTLQKTTTSVSNEINFRAASGWKRFELKINGKIFSSLEDGGFNTDAFKKEIQNTTGEMPSEDQVLEMIRMMDNEGRFAGYARLGSSTGLTLTEQGSKNSNTEQESVSLSYSNGKWTYDCKSEDGYLRAITLPKEKTSLTLISQDKDGKIFDEGKTPELFKMRRFYSLEYTPPQSDQKAGDDIAKRLEITDSRQGFFLNTAENNVAAYGSNAVQ